jgi:hypothetical protein
MSPLLGAKPTSGRRSDISVFDRHVEDFIENLTQLLRAGRDGASPRKPFFAVDSVDKAAPPSFKSIEIFEHRPL